MAAHVKNVGAAAAIIKLYKLRQIRIKYFGYNKLNDLAIATAPRWRNASPRIVLRES